MASNAKPELEQRFDVLFEALDISEEMRLSQLKRRYEHEEHPLFKGLLQLAGDNKSVADTAPHPLIDRVLFQMLNSCFPPEAFWLEDKPSIEWPLIVPFPMKGTKALVWNLSPRPIVVLNEYDLIVGECLAPLMVKLHSQVALQAHSIALDFNLFPPELYSLDPLKAFSHFAPKWIELLYSDARSDFVSRNFAYIIPIIEFNLHITVDYEKWLMIINPFISTMEKSDFTFFLANARKKYLSRYDIFTIHDEHRSISVLFGYIRSRIAHELGHLKLRHFSAEKYKWSPKMVNFKTPHVERIAKELSADKTGMGLWINPSSIDRTFSFFGFIISYLSDEFVSLMRVTSYAGRGLSDQENALGFIEGYPNRPIIPLLFGSHPTALERMMELNYIPLDYFFSTNVDAGYCSVIHAALHSCCLTIPNHLISDDHEEWTRAGLIEFGKHFQFKGKHPLLGQDAFLERFKIFNNLNVSDRQQIDDCFNTEWSPGFNDHYERGDYKAAISSMFQSLNTVFPGFMNND